MKILLLGANGQVGWELQRSLAPLGEIMACDLNEVDITDSAALATLVSDYAPRVIVNAAAYTAVDQAESDQDAAFKVNRDAVKVLAEGAKKLDAWLIHYSTDYVFDGNQATPYKEDDSTNPTSVYGDSKWQGDQAVIDSGCKHLIFRVSWVYASRGHNFIKTMIRLAKEREELRVVSDQIGVPTSAELIADVTAFGLLRVTRASAADSDYSGIYNLAPTGAISWYDFACFILSEVASRGVQLKVKAEGVQPITSAEFPQVAKRPSNSRLDTTRIKQAFDIHLPQWQYHVRRTIEELQQ
jgi:dTDP-4-dehydrorhamnose reductase